MVDFSDTLAHLRRLEARKQSAAESRAGELRARLGDAARLLRTRGARRVILFGSLNESAPRLEADVDLAVEGLPRSAYFSVMAELMALFGTRVDLVRLEDAPHSLRDRIHVEGQPL